MKAQDIKKDLKVIVDYLWHDEARHYEESRRKDHIFLTLKRLVKKINHCPNN